MGFLACAAVVRREAYLRVGGFHPRFGVGGEEALLAVDMLADGWDIAYVPDLVVHHHPSTSRDNHDRRRRQEIRNALWVAWLRRTAADALRVTVRATVGAEADANSRRGPLEAARGVGWVARQRRVAPAGVCRAIAAVEAA